MTERIIQLLLCHLIGDYVLQIDFIAKTKGQNLYHLFVHCALYCVPFYVCFGMDMKLLALFISHFIIDLFKARYNKINYVTDQIIHYLILLIYIFG